MGEGVKNDSTPVLREVLLKKGDLTPVQVPGTPRPANAQAAVAGGREQAAGCAERRSRPRQPLLGALQVQGAHANVVLTV